MSLSWIENCLLGTAAALLFVGLLPKLRSYRSLLWGSGMLALITALIPRPGNGIGHYLFAAEPTGLHLPLQLFGLAWWILGAWLVKSVLDLVLRRTIFPHDNQPHARRLFADLASALVYVVAFVGIIETVLKQPISAVLATSGVLAIVLGLALQNTLADVFSGLAINVEHPFRAGDWITMNDNVEGQIIEIDWRATRIRTFANDMVVIPNSVIAKAIVTNHRKLNEPHVSSLSLKIDASLSPVSIIKALESAASASPGVASGSKPAAYACGFADSLVIYKLYFAVESFILTPEVLSQVTIRVTETLRSEGIQVGALPTDIRIIPNDIAAGALTAAHDEIS